MALKLASLAVGFVIANYGYQYATNADWLAAFDRSLHQAAALLMAYLITRESK